MKFKKLFALLFIFVLLAFSFLTSFATDVVMDGASGDITPMVAPIPIRAFSIQASSGISTSDLDSYIFSSGGFFRSGDLINETLNIEYSYNDTTVDKSILRVYQSDNLARITESFVVNGDVQHNTFQTTDSFNVTVYFEDFWFYRDSHGDFPALSRPEFFISALGSSDFFSTQPLNGGFVTYNGYYRFGQMSDHVISSSDVDFEFQRREFSYKDIQSYSEFVTLVPDGMLNFLCSSAQSSTVDDFNDVVLVEDLKATFVVKASSGVLGMSKSFGIDNFYYTYDDWQQIVYSIYRYPYYSKEVDAIVSSGPVYIDEIPVGEFLDNSIGPFFETPVLGWFSIGDIVGGVLGLTLLVVFLKFFAGG